MFTLLLSLAAAHPHTEPTPDAIEQQALLGSAVMHHLERDLARLSEAELAQAREAAKTLTTTCPYNRATLEMVGILVARVPQDSATRPGVDALARSLELLGLETSDGDLEALDQRFRGLEPVVEALSDEELEIIQSSGGTLQGFTGTWPPKRVFEPWSEQLSAEGHEQLAYLIQVQLGNTC